MKKVVLLTGKPGTGKTTMILKLVSEINIKFSGFYTEEIRKDKERIGFEVVTFDGERKILASVKITTPYKVGRYCVDLSAMELGCKSIKKGIVSDSLIIIDEIGRMELISKDFRDIVTKALNSNCKLLGTITIKPHPFADEIKKRKDVELFTLTRDNFIEIFEKLKNYFKL